MPICLLGASGYTGALIAGELAARGASFVACGRDPDRVRAVLAPLGSAVVDVRQVDVTDPDSLPAALRGCAIAISSIGPYERFGRAVVDAVIDAGVHLVDVSGEQRYVGWVSTERDGDAERAGVVLAPGAGFTGGIGQLLAAIAADAAGRRPEVHVAYTARGGGRGAWSTGTRRSVAGMLGQMPQAYADGKLVPEPLGEARRLAWFPRPVGAMHAAAVPGVEAVMVPRHVADAAQVHTYLAMSTWKAEGLQAIGNACRWEPVRRRVSMRLERFVEGPSAEGRGRTRWACVAEARGSRGIARAWAYGHDPYGTAACLAVRVTEVVGEGSGRRGAVPVAAIADPADTLDALSVRTGLRWSVSRPGDGS